VTAMDDENSRTSCRRCFAANRRWGDLRLCQHQATPASYNEADEGNRTKQMMAASQPSVLMVNLKRCAVLFWTVLYFMSPLLARSASLS
jgi:hypothetical protein